MATHSVLHALTMIVRDSENKSKLLLALIANIEAAVKSSGANFQLKLLLIQLNNMIGGLRFVTI